jgi:hypothetical protein
MVKFRTAVFCVKTSYKFGGIYCLRLQGIPQDEALCYSNVGTNISHYTPRDTGAFSANYKRLVLHMVST